jgi:hypothetical protein
VDVLGFELDEALAQLEAKGWRVKVKLTSPPGTVPPGPRRVVRVVMTGAQEVEIVAAHQGWEGNRFPDGIVNHK